MKYVFYNYHQHIDSDKRATEKKYTDSHNVMMTPSNRILDKEKSFAGNGMKPHEIPYDITFVLGLSGGGVIKKHLKKDDAIKALKVRAIMTIKKPEDLDVGIQFPIEFKTFLDNVEKTAEDIMILKAQGTMVVKAGLRTTSDDNLKMLREIMDASAREGRRGTSEERVLKAINVMFPTMLMLENSKIAISIAQVKMMNNFVSLYAHEYNKYGSGAASFDNEAFIKDVEQEQSRRQTLREEAERLRQPEPVIEQAANRCTIS